MYFKRNLFQRRNGSTSSTEPAAKRSKQQNSQTHASPAALVSVKVVSLSGQVLADLTIEASRCVTELIDKVFPTPVCICSISSFATSQATDGDRFLC